MIPDLTISFPRTIEFGVGKINTLPSHLMGRPKVFFLVDPPVLELASPLVDRLAGDGWQIEVSTEVVPEPPIEALKSLLAPVRAFGPDAVVGIGGGSTMDLAKLVSVLYDGVQGVEEIVGIGNVSGRRVKLIAAAATSGTGSEVTPIAVLTDVKAQLKKGVVSPHIIPDVAIVDPSLTLSAPPAITASTGMDAMTHCIEAYTNRHSHPMVDAFALEGIRLIAENLETAVIDGANLGARSAMALGSMYGGLCLGPVNTAAVHALAYPLGGTYHVPHGVSNSMLLPFVMDFNLPSCSDKYAHVARLLGVTDDCASDELARRGIQRIGRLAAECGIPKSLKELDIPETALPSMAASAMEVKRLLDNNPRPVTATDAEAIFRAAYQGVVDEGAV